MVTGCLQQCRLRRTEQIYSTHTEHTQTHTLTNIQTYTCVGVCKASEFKTGSTQGCVNNEVGVRTASIALTEGGQSKTVLCLCVFSSVPWEFGCWEDEQCVGACVCVSDRSPYESESQPDPPPAGTVMPPPNPLPTLHLVRH